MPRVRPQIGLVIALLGPPQPAHADVLLNPKGKRAVEVTIAIENLDAHPEYLFVLWPGGCLRNDETFAKYTVLSSQEDDGRNDFSEDGCVAQRLFAFPRDTYSVTDDVLAENGRRQLSNDPPSDPRVLVRPIKAEALWWVPFEVDLYGIEDVYRVGIDAGALTLTPTRVRFDHGSGRILDRAFNKKGQRPRIPRPEDIPPAPPPEPVAAAPAVADGTPPEAKAEPAPIAAEAPAPIAPAPASAPTPPPPAAKPREEISAGPWPPPPLMYGGACLLVAVAAGLALRRRK
ncbi:hypothetical protein [Nannocystis punicea]|uniref:Uncharacterized protein n=1 Tax=Nannocystis punicea TaxID=2995304 RepID=A0ABY7H1P8_9BACT|nr:hypothetical protein [Nannocystis poenicansa]WAS93194.1 hypothetical protein O0S08_44085 [Nannocystis poenicansa]